MKEPLRVPLEATEPDLVGPRLVHETGGGDRKALPGFCAELSEARHRGGYSVSDAAHVLRIQQHYLEALEEGRFDQIPGTTYTIGFLRSYSGFLGLDPDEIIDAFKREQGLDTKEQRLAFPSPTDSSPKPKFWLILLVLVLAGLAYGGWQYQSTGGQIATDLVDDVSTKLTEAVGLGETAATGEGATEEGAAAETVAVVTATEPAAEAPTETTAAPAAETGTETATATVVAEVTTAAPAEPEPAALEEAAPAAAAPRQEEPTPAEPAATDASEAGLIPAAEVWDEARPAQTADAAALERTQAEGAPVQPPPARAEAAAEFASAPVAPAEPEQAAEAAAPTAPGEPSVATAETSDPGPAIASPLDFAVAEVGGGATSSPGSDADEAITGDAAQPGGNTDRIDVARIEPTATEAVDEAATASSALEPLADAAPEETASQQSAVSDDPPPLSADPDYVPKVYGRSNLGARVVITAVDDSWVQVQGPDNELLLTRILHAGDSYRVPDRPGLFMVTGNAGGLEVKVDDSVAPALGPLGVVMRNIALDPDRLLAGTAAGG